MLAEDLAQEARLRICEYMADTLDAPLSHYVVCAKEGISQALRRGCSVDTRIVAPERKVHYAFAHLDKPYRESDTPQHEVFTYAQEGTESLALTRVLHAQLSALLNGDQREALQMRLSGYGWDEIGEAFYGYSRFNLDASGLTRTQALMVGLREKALALWAPPEMHAPKARKRQRKDNHYVLADIPSTVREHLTEQEQEALAYYQEDYPQTEAARLAGMSQSQFHYLLNHVREGKQEPRVKRPKNDDRCRQFFALFEQNELITREQMLAFFADTQHPSASICVTIKRYNRRLNGAQIVQEAGGYRLVQT